MAFVIGIVSIAAITLGALSMAASIVPSYGNQSDGRPAFILGVVLFIAGIAGLFYGGSLL